MSEGDPSRIPELDGVRGFACLTVVLYHYISMSVSIWAPLPMQYIGQLLSLGWAGVDLFFVLSGFLLGGQLIDHRQSQRVFRVFYARRCFRIFPLYFAWVALFFLLRDVPGWPLGLFDDSMPAWAYLFYVQNLFDAVNGHWGAHWMTITWSLAIEEQFYLILPALVVMSPVRHLPRVLILLIVAAPVLRYWLSLTLPEHALASYALLPCRWDALFLGVLGAWAVRQEPVRRSLLAHPWFLRSLFVEFALIVLIFTYRAPWYSPSIREFGHTLLASGCLCLILLAIYDPWISRLFRFAPLMLLGTISYGVYLIHPVINWLVHWGALDAYPNVGSWREVGVSATAFGATVLVAVLSYRYFERPMIQLGRRWRY